MILNFTAGAIVGAAMTYVFKDKDAKDKVMSGIGSLKKKTEELTSSNETDVQSDLDETDAVQSESVATAEVVEAEAVKTA